MHDSDLRARLEAIHPAAWTWALHCCRGDTEEGGDVLQASYLAVLEGKASYGGRSTFRTWFFGVVRRTAAGRRRTRWLRSLLLQREASSWSTSAPPGIDARMESADRDRLLDDALATLSERQRHVIELVFRHDLTVEEAATVLGVTVGTARTHYARGKARLATLLEHSELR